MRILQISHVHHIRGGSDAVFMETSDLLRRAGHEVIPFCMDHPDNHPTPWAKYFPKGADTARPNLADSLRYFFSVEARHNLENLIREVGPIDVAHLHIYHGKHTPSILPVLRKAGIPVLHSLHEYKLACPVYTMQRKNQPCDECVSGSPLNCVLHRCKDGSVAKSLVMATEFATARWLGDIRYVDRFLCVSDFQRNIMIRAGLPRDKSFTLHNFVQQPAEITPGVHDGYLLYFGRLDPVKGLATLIRAVRDTGQHLLIAGDGSWRSEMQAQIADADNIDYLGFCTGTKLKRLVNRAKAVVVPSEWNENCPMSVIESLASGTPVIGARIGGIPELICHGQDGLLFEPGNAEELRKQLLRFETLDYTKLSTQARQTATSRFGTEAYLSSLMGHYNGAVALNMPGEVALA